MSIKTRFAPSPTGKVHIGNIRTAIVVWLFARAKQGHFLLRIDDTDLERSKAEYTEALKRDWQWLGLDWDSTFHQTDPERVVAHADAIEKLKAAGRLYPCYETQDELALKRKVQLNQGKPPIYDRAALKLTDEQKAEYEAKGIKPHWRFLMNPTEIAWTDLVRGEVKFNGADLSDPVMIREDGRPLYHLGSVVDDIDTKITHIVRGEDHISNTAVHIQMFEAFGAPVPQFAHLSLIADKEGGKLSKRLGSISIEELREEEGIEPMAILSLLGRLGTSLPVEPLTSIDALLKDFDFGIFSKATPKLDTEELFRLNEKIVHQLSYDDVKDRLPKEVDEGFWNAVRSNLEKVDDIKQWVDIVHTRPMPQLSPIEIDFVRQASDLLPQGDLTGASWNEWMAAVKPKTDRKGKELFMPLRQALTGMDHGPELGVLLPLLGRDEVLKRLAA